MNELLHREPLFGPSIERIAPSGYTMEKPSGAAFSAILRICAAVRGDYAGQWQSFAYSDCN